MKDAKEKETIIGRGLAFPLQTNVRGEVALVSGVKDIEQAIWIILGTRLGERVMRPTFGCRVYNLIFEPVNAVTATLIQDYVKEALTFWEPRIEVVSVLSYLDDDQEGAVLVDIEYEIKETHDVRSIVYPFYLSGEEPRMDMEEH
jgi:phage baseplate assembly protein W